MQEFDPRRPTFRLTPRLAIGIAGVAALALGWKLTADQAAAPPKAPLDPAAITALQHAAFTQSEAQPGFGRPQSVPVKVLPGETLESAVERAGVPRDEARRAVETPVSYTHLTLPTICSV